MHRELETDEVGEDGCGALLCPDRGRADWRGSFCWEGETVVEELLVSFGSEEEVDGMLETEGLVDVRDDVWACVRLSVMVVSTARRDVYLSKQSAQIGLLLRASCSAAADLRVRG